MFETRHHQQWCFFIFHELEQGRIVLAPKTIFIRSFAEPLCIPFQPQLETPSWTPPARIKHVDLSFGGDDEDSDDDVEHVEVGLGAIAGVWGKVALRVSHWLFSYPPLVIAREIVLSAPHRLSRLSRTSKRGGAEQEDLLLASDAEQVNPTLGKIIMVWQVPKVSP